MLNRLKDFLSASLIKKSVDSSPVFNEQKSRSDFESSTFAVTGGRLSRQSNDCYFDPFVENLWQGWLACAKFNHAELLYRLDEQRISEDAM